MKNIKEIIGNIKTMPNQVYNTFYWDKDVCGFITQQNKEGTLPVYSVEQVNEMIAGGTISVGDDGLPKVTPREKNAVLFGDKEAQYKRLVVKLIRERYCADDEIAILRQQESKSEEYLAYFEYCEECKKRAKEEVYDNEV